jgi:hypothetical protein
LVDALIALHSIFVTEIPPPSSLLVPASRVGTLATGNAAVGNARSVAVRYQLQFEGLPTDLQPVIGTETATQRHFRLPFLASL